MHLDRVKNLESFRNVFEMMKDPFKFKRSTRHTKMQYVDISEYKRVPAEEQGWEGLTFKMHP